MYSYKILETVEDMLPYYDLVKKLNNKFDESMYAVLLTEMISRGYKQLIMLDGDRCVALSGFWILTKLYCGRYLELDNVIVDPEVRSKGIGLLLCKRMDELAREAGCTCTVLDAYVENDRAHRFYFKQGYKVMGFHFYRKLS